MCGIACLTEPPRLRYAAKMKPKVYIETSVVSYCAGRGSRDVVIAGHQQSTLDLRHLLGSKLGRRHMKDPHVEEVRKHRMEHTRQFDFNLHLICEDLRKFEASLGERVVTLEPKKPRRARASRKATPRRGKP